MASRATDHGEIVEVVQLLRRGVDCGVSCHRSLENRESDSAFAMRSRSWRLVQARRVATTGLLVQTVQNTVWRYTGAGANCTEDCRFRGAVLDGR